MRLPKQYEWLYSEKAPKHLTEAIKHYGELEHPGKGSNPNIMGWAKECGVSGWYTDDDIPWCGLFVGVVIKRSGHPVKPDLLSSLSWSKFGVEVHKSDANLFDILVFKRPGGGHVGFYVAESDESFLVYGGNQSNAVGFTWILKERLVACRRPQGETQTRKITLNRNGRLSINEQ